jgi:hypothetical protein
VDQEVGGSNPPSCTTAVEDRRPSRTIVRAERRYWDELTEVHFLEVYRGSGCIAHTPAQSVHVFLQGAREHGALRRYPCGDGSNSFSGQALA